MCFLNPKYQLAFTLKVCTAFGSKEDFDKNIEKALPMLLELEQKLNSSGNLRWCIQENKENDNTKTD